MIWLCNQYKLCTCACVRLLGVCARYVQQSWPIPKVHGISPPIARVLPWQNRCSSNIKPLPRCTHISSLQQTSCAQALPTSQFLGTVPTSAAVPPAACLFSYGQCETQNAPFLGPHTCILPMQKNGTFLGSHIHTAGTARLAAHTQPNLWPTYCSSRLTAHIHTHTLHPPHSQWL